MEFPHPLEPVAGVCRDWGGSARNVLGWFVGLDWLWTRSWGRWGLREKKIPFGEFELLILNNASYGCINVEAIVRLLLEKRWSKGLAQSMGRLAAKRSVSIPWRLEDRRA